MNDENVENTSSEEVERYLSVNNSSDEDLLTISRKDATSLLKLFDGIRKADDFFHNCQATQFRDHVRSLCASGKIARAFEALRKASEGRETE